MDADDLDLFRRSLASAVASSTGAHLDSALADLGWSDALADDRRAAIATLFELQGRATATSFAFDVILTDALGLDLTALVLPAIGRPDPPGTVVGDDLVVDGLVTGHAARCGSIAVVTGSLVVVEVPTALLTLTPVEGIDPAFELHRVSGTITGAAWAPPVAPEQWTSAIAIARLALAHELVGVSRRMLELAREHALERVQFGVPISSFQAIRHRLAETLVAIEMAEAVIDAAWIDGLPTTAAMAKAVAGRSARTSMRHCQQVLAGIGFTTEHDLHRSIRRTLVLDELFGTAATLTRELGDDLVRTRQLPPLLPL